MWSSLLPIGLFLLPTALAGPQQTLFSPESTVINAQTSELTLASFSSAAAASSFSGDGFVHIQHPDIPTHSIRIKETTGWCETKAKSFSGYLNVGDDKDLWFQFFESRSEPSKDDVLMWINGGPGCSSSMGLFMELGPCSIVSNPSSDGSLGPNLTTKHNPYSWNENANLFFLDQPIGVGLSHAHHGQTVDRTEQAAVDVRAFIQIFFETFKEFKGRSLHLSGESYAGRYLPVFATAIYDGNKALVASGGTAINLKSILIGNALVNMGLQMPGYLLQSCTSGSGYGPLLGVGVCQAMALALPRCKEMLQRECVDRNDPLGCPNAFAFCQTVLWEPFMAAERNVYDISKSCTAEEQATSTCYSQTSVIATYLNLPSVRSLLGIEPNSTTFQSCSEEVGIAFNVAGDVLTPSHLYVAALLEHGVDVLVYAGKYDWICNYRGINLWTSALEWTGQDAFNTAAETDWIVDGKVAGQTKKALGMTFTTINEAGHLAPYDKPKESLHMLQKWLAGEEM